MRRRKVLAGTTGALFPLAGCLGDSSPDVECPGDDGSALIDETDDGTVDDGLTASFTSLDDPPDPLCVEVVVLTDRLTATEFPAFEVTVENGGTGTATWSQVGTEHAFPTQRTTEDVLVIGTEQEIDEYLIDGVDCAQMGGSPQREDTLVETRLEPGESISQRYVVVGNNNVLVGECPASGTYRAESEYDGLGAWGFEFELRA